MSAANPSYHPAPMFSYRHGFHAGNHADVLKHMVLIAVLKHLTAKPTAIAVVDTHAGAGLYRRGCNHVRAIVRLGLIAPDDVPRPNATFTGLDIPGSRWA